MTKKMKTIEYNKHNDMGRSMHWIRYNDENQWRMEIWTHIYEGPV